VFTFIFVSIFVFGWLLLGFLPWLGLSVATRGNAGLVNLPLCLLAAVVAGLAVPLLGKDDAQGLWLSALAAFLAPCALLAARRFSLGASAAAARARKRESPDSAR
jgi:hypothetical protein